MTQKRPNILIIMSDDHAHWAAGCYGNSELVTPAMDYIAASGVQLSRSYTPNPVCSPARACFFTGRYPSQHGIHDYLKEDGVCDATALDGEETIAQRLKDAGYKTGLVGKWHCGSSHVPKAGFDYWFSYRNGQYPHWGDHEFVENEKDIEGKGQQAPILTENAIKFIREQDEDAPFFLFVGYVDTHSPFCLHPPRWVEHYRKAAFNDIPDESWPEDREGWIRFGVPESPKERREWLIQYYASVSTIDEQIGKLLDELDAKGELENTLIVYTSDHGHMNGHHGLYTKGNATVPQNFLDESVHVPCLMRWPHKIPAGQKKDFLNDHCDLFQTVLEAADAAPTEADAHRNYPGKSYWQAITSQAAYRKPFQFFDYGNARAIFDGRFKWIRRYPAGEQHFSNELYDMELDPRETKNLAQDPAHRTLIDRLDKEMETFFNKIEEPGKSGRSILDIPPHNPYEPWRLPSPEKNASEMDALRYRAPSKG